MKPIARAPDHDKKLFVDGTPEEEKKMKMKLMKIDENLGNLATTS